MPMVEIDENELNGLRRVRETIAKISSTPDGKLLLQRAHKRVDPNAITPELDEEEARSKTQSDWQKKFEELEAKVQSDREKRDSDAQLAAANARWEGGRRTLREAGYTAEGIEMVEKLMQEKGIGDHEIAAAWIEKQNPPQDVLTPRAFG